MTMLAKGSLLMMPSSSSRPALANRRTKETRRSVLQQLPGDRLIAKPADGLVFHRGNALGQRQRVATTSAQLGVGAGDVHRRMPERRHGVQPRQLQCYA